MTTLIEKVFSEKAKKTSERVIINIAIISFIVHLVLILLNKIEVFKYLKLINF